MSLNVDSLFPREGGPGPSDNAYGYIPTRWICFMFLGLFGVSTAIHITQAVRYKMWWIFMTMIACGALELGGWAGRLWSSYNVLSEGAFNLQITLTIIAPTPLLAANFVLFGVIIRELGSSYSRLLPKWYTIIFCTCDFISLIVQAAGGGLAASAEDGEDPALGGNIMLGGIIFQLVSMIIYLVLGAEYFWRYFNDNPVPSAKANRHLHTPRQPIDHEMKIMLAAMLGNTGCLFIRGIYRMIELMGGWHGTIIRTQIWFNIFDGAMIVVAIYIFNFFHPGKYLPAAQAAHGRVPTSESTIRLEDQSSFMSSSKV